MSLGHRRFGLGIVSSYLITWVLGAHILLCGDVETERKSLTIKTKLRIVRLIEPEMIQNKGLNPV